MGKSGGLIRERKCREERSRPEANSLSSTVTFGFQPLRMEIGPGECDKGVEVPGEGFNMGIDRITIFEVGQRVDIDILWPEVAIQLLNAFSRILIGCSIARKKEKNKYAGNDQCKLSGWIWTRRILHLKDTISYGHLEFAWGGDVGRRRRG